MISLFLIFQLGFFILALYDYSCRNMSKSYSRICHVDVLSAVACRAFHILCVLRDLIRDHNVGRCAGGIPVIDHIGKVLAALHTLSVNGHGICGLRGGKNILVRLMNDRDNTPCTEFLC